MDAPKLNPQDSLKVSFPKLNQSIDNANEALKKSGTAITTASEAKTTAESTKTQLNEIVVNGDSSVEAAQARVRTIDNEITTFDVLVDRLNDSDKNISVTNLKTDWEVVEGYGDGTKSDSAFIQQAITDAGFNSKVYLPKPKVAYVIDTPITVRQGQIIEFAKNTQVYDRTNDYCFKVIGGAGFASEAKTHVTIKNAEIIGSATSLGAIKLVNVYLVDLENLKITSYTNAAAKAIYIEDFFQINLKTVQINATSNGHGLYINAVTGNSGQLNLYNTIIQRNRIGVEAIGTSNIIDGINFYGGAIGNNNQTGMKIGKNVYNVVFIGSHLENHDTTTFPGDTAIDMVLADGTVAEGITFLNCLFENNKFAIKSNNTRRVTVIGCQFNGENISGGAGITQGTGDSAWFIAPNMFTGYTNEIIELGSNPTNLRRLNINDSGVVFPQRSPAGIFSGSVFPESTVAANQGSLYMRTNGSDGSTIYFKTSGTGNTGWKAVQVVSSGTTAQRPTSVPSGFMYSDLTLNKPIWYINNQWRDANGVIV